MPSTTILIFIIGLALAIPALRWLSHRGERLFEAERLRTIDWSSYRDYGDLTDAADDAHALAPEDFLNGPFKRFLEICTDKRENVRVRARTMEFGVGALWSYCQALRARGQNPALFKDRARTMAVEWFGRPETPNGDYMLEVFDGISNHNYRGHRSDKPAFDWSEA